jgi:hypothetical protein
VKLDPNTLTIESKNPDSIELVLVCIESAGGICVVFVGCVKICIFVDLDICYLIILDIF